MLQKVKDHFATVRHDRSVFNPIEQRVFGLVSIAEGICQIFLGKYSPALTYKYALWGAKKYHGH